MPLIQTGGLSIIYAGSPQELHAHFEPKIARAWQDSEQRGTMFHAVAESVVAAAFASDTAAQVFSVPFKEPSRLSPHGRPSKVGRMYADVLGELTASQTSALLPETPVRTQIINDEGNRPLRRFRWSILGAVKTPEATKVVSVAAIDRMSEARTKSSWAPHLVQGWLLRASHQDNRGPNPQSLGALFTQEFSELYLASSLGDA